MFSTAKQLSAAYENSHMKRAIFMMGSNTWDYYSKPVEVPETLSIKKAQETLNKLKDDYLEHNLGKHLRPWDLFDVTADLDPAQAWVGVELETGFCEEEEYQQVVNWMWDNVNHSTIDAEGCGNYYCELTLPPMNASQFFSEDGHLNKLIKFLNESKLDQHRVHDDPYEDDDYYDDEGQIGLHVNISTPAFRKLTTEAASRVVSVLCASGCMLNDKSALFGRQPYGWFYLQGDNGKHWIEGKLFDSSHDPKIIEHYMQVMARLVDVIEILSQANGYIPESTKRSKGDRRLFVKNFQDILSGKVAPTVMEASTTTVSIFDYW